MTTAGAIARTAHLAGRLVLTGVVRRLPPGVVDRLRRPDRVPDAVRAMLRRGGIPRWVRTFTLSDNPALGFVNADSLVLQQVFWFGERGWEPELLPWWRSACRRSTRILELGANVGYFTVQGAAAAPRASYLAVEPHPVSAAVCRQNLALNAVTSVRVLAVAATADPATPRAELLVPWEQLATPTVAFLPGGSELPPDMAERATTAISVPAIDVRSLLRGADLVKIDVEGQEHALLSAGWSQLRDSRPTVFVEVLPGTPQLRAVLMRLCDELGYRCYIPTPERLIPLPAEHVRTVALRSEYGTNDLVLCPVERDSWDD